MANEVKIYNVRIAFPALFDAKPFRGDASKARFEATFLMPPTHPAVPKLRKAMLDAVVKKWGAEKASEILESLTRKDDVCLRNGNDKSEYGGFAGNLYLASASKIRPIVVGQEIEPDPDRPGMKRYRPLTEADGKIYGGCYVNASVDIYGHDKEGKRVIATLLSVQFAKDGDAFGGGSRVGAADFGDLNAKGDDGDDLAA